MDEYAEALLDQARAEAAGLTTRTAPEPIPSGRAIPADGYSTPDGVAQFFTPGLSMPGGPDPIRP